MQRAKKEQHADEAMQCEPALVPHSLVVGEDAQASQKVEPDDIERARARRGEGNEYCGDRLAPHKRIDAKQHRVQAKQDECGESEPAMQADCGAESTE